MNQLGDGSESTDEADLVGGGHRFLPELLKPSARRVNMDLIYVSLKRAGLGGNTPQTAESADEKLK